MSEPRINVYLCEYNCHTVTIDRDEGTTPMFIKCRARSRPGRPIHPDYLDKNGECIGRATSSMYPKGPRPAHIGEPTHEWYRPTSLDGLDDATIDHVKRGGLLLREIEGAVPANEPQVVSVRFHPRPTREARQGKPKNKDARHLSRSERKKGSR